MEVTREVAKHTVKAIYSLLRLVSILVPHERETPRVPAPEKPQTNSDETPYRNNTQRRSELDGVLTSGPAG